MNSGDVVIAAFPGANVTKARPAVVLSTALYHNHRPDVILGIITTRLADSRCPTDYELRDWSVAGLHAPSTFRLYVVTLLQADVRVVGSLTSHDWEEVVQRVSLGLIGVRPTG